MQKIFSIFSVLLFCLSLGMLLFSSKVFAETTDPNLPDLVISEIQTGGCAEFDTIDTNKCLDEEPASEFLELKNTTNQTLSLVNWRVEYLSGSGKVTSQLAEMNGIVNPEGYILIAHDAYLEVSDFHFGSGNSSVLGKTIGQIQVVESNNNIVDRVAWGSSSSVVNDGWPILAPIIPGYSVKRILPGDLLYGTGVQFTVSTIPVSPQGGGYVASYSGDNTGANTDNDGTGDDSGSSDNNDSGGQGAGPQTSCDGVIISELLPNPAGTDSGHEFIEIHNPTKDIIDMAGCKLQTSTSSKIYEFADLQLQPGQYKAFYNDKTGLTLANSGGGSVYLIDTDDTEIYQVDYEADLGDDVSWSLIGSHWTQSFSVTPDKANELLESKPCPAGQTRNGDTGRCINIIEEAAGLAPCSEGKERNPATNRCRNIASLATALKACAANQVRNPVTNRCRKIDGSTSALAPCKPGQERNPQTHRCRKAAATSSAGNLNDVKDVLSASSKNTANWTVAALAVLGALSYAIFEWRNEIFQQLGIFKSKFS